MAAQEHAPSRTALLAELAALERRLEVVDTDENPLERSLKRERLLEASDQLQAALADSEPPTGSQGDAAE
jgi:hypothetical protein